MDSGRIAELLSPFLGRERLNQVQIGQVSAYLDLLLRWNQRINLTSVRQAEQIINRHFGESLFAARHLLRADDSASVIDVGSGAGFPGLPMKIYAPTIGLTLIESQHKKATFLREVARTLTLTGVTVFAGRAESYDGPTAHIVTMRAVERFERTLPTAAALVAAAGRLALLVGESQVTAAQTALPGFQWEKTSHVPASSTRVLLVGRKLERDESGE